LTIDIRNKTDKHTDTHRTLFSVFWLNDADFAESYANSIL
jgi:hypothetical protein